MSKYQNRISGPILDRIDIHLEVQRVPIAKLASLDSGESSGVIRERMQAARKIQQARFSTLGKPNVLVNGDMGSDGGQWFCGLDAAAFSIVSDTTLLTQTPEGALPGPITVKTRNTIGTSTTSFMAEVVYRVFMPSSLGR